MARIIGIDYGLKRTGLAVTDPLQIIGSSLDTVETAKLIDYLKKYFETEEVDTFVIGLPQKLNGKAAEILPQIEAFAQSLQTLFPEKNIAWQDERFTSRQAQAVIIQTVKGKKKRQEKGLVDRISAAIILQEYLEKNRTFLP